MQSTTQSTVNPDPDPDLDLPEVNTAEKRSLSGRAVVVSPTYNEIENLPRMVEKIATLRRDLDLDLLIVDDESPDGTGHLADELAKTHPFLHVLHREGKRGLGLAYCDGFSWALDHGYSKIVQMDGDLSHDPEDVPSLLKLADEADLVLGSRYINGIRVINWPLNRLILSIFAAHYVRWITGMPIEDPTGGFKCFRREALQSIDLGAIHSNGYSFQIEMTHRIWRQGMKVVEAPIIFTDRFQGASKMSRGIALEACWVTWRLLACHGFRRRPRKMKLGQEQIGAESSRTGNC